MPRTKQTVSEGSYKGLKEQIQALQQKIDILERGNIQSPKASPTRETHDTENDDAYITLPKEKMVDLLGILTHCLKKEQQREQARPVYDGNLPVSASPSAMPPPANESTSLSKMPWRRFTTFV